MSDVLNQPSFGEVHFGDCALGDCRRNRRLVDLADRIHQHPEGSLPHKLRDPAAYRAWCRLMNQAPVTHAAVLGPHRQHTLQQMRQQAGPVLILHDFTELDYSGHQTLRGLLGQIGNGGGQGYECHNSLAVEPDRGQVLGLVNQILHRRRHAPPGEGIAAKRDCPGRESRVWLEAVQAIGPAPAGALWVDVADRGADTFEFLEHECRHGRHFVVRSRYNRGLLAEADGGPAALHDLLRAQAPVLGWTVTVAAQGGQPARRARVVAAYRAVTVRAPHTGRRGQYPRRPLPLWGIRVWEVDPPAGVSEPLEWLLVTNVPVEDAARLRERVSWYERRPLVEEFHKAQKTGMAIESLQFTTEGALQPAIALLSVVAVGLLNLREGARDDARAEQPATTQVEAVYVEALSVWRYGQARDLTVREFTQALGRLGGHLGRKCDGLPGWQTLWRGWNQLQTLVTYEKSRAKCGKS
jgi:transposase-like protein